MGHSKSSSKREVNNNTILPQKQEKSQINNLMLHLNQLKKEEKTKPTLTRRKEIIKIRAEIYKIEATNKQTNKNKSKDQ